MKISTGLEEPDWRKSVSNMEKLFTTKNAIFSNEIIKLINFLPPTAIVQIHTYIFNKKKKNPLSSAYFFIWSAFFVALIGSLIQKKVI